MSFPNDKEIQEVLKNIKDDDFSLVLPDDASNVDRTKYELCQKFVSYLLDHNMSQAELSRKLNVDRSRINWIVKYRIEKFSIDRLYELWILIDPDFQLKAS